MRSRVIFALTAIAVASAWSAQENVMTIDDSRGDFSARLGNAHWKDLGGHPKFDSSGTPNTIWQNSEGLRIDALKFSGRYTVAKRTKYNLDEILAEGKVNIDYDSDTARKFQLTNGLKTTDQAGIKTELQSETAQFTQDPTDDTITLPKPFVATDNRPGKDDNGPTLSSSIVTGKSGLFHFVAPEQGGKAKLRTADVQGPVHYHAVLTTTDPHTKAPLVTTYDIVGDHFTADLTDPKVGHLDLDGHIKWSRTTPEDEGLNGTCSHLTLTTDADGKVTELETLSNNVSGQVPKDKKP